MLLLLFLGPGVAMRIVEVIRCVAKGVNFEFREQVLGQFLEKPIEDEPSFDATLRMKDKHHLGILGVVERIFENLVS